MHKSTTSSSISACVNAPGMSIDAMSCFSSASMMQESISASKATVGARASSFLCGNCLCPSVHPRPLIIPIAFSTETLVTLEHPIFLSC